MGCTPTNYPLSDNFSYVHAEGGFRTDLNFRPGKIQITLLSVVETRGIIMIAHNSPEIVYARPDGQVLRF